MKISSNKARRAELFGKKVYNLLVENFPLSFYVGGFVRDKLLKRKTCDIDIATSATSEQIIALLRKKGIGYSDAGRQFGVIRIESKGCNVEIATFRKELYGSSRYPKIELVKNPKTDAKRRDFSINALYLGQNDKKPLDYHGGLKDISLRKIRFIGNPHKRIKEDPLRIVRALRFCLDLNFKLDKKDWFAVVKNFELLKTLTKKKIESEIAKTRDVRKRKRLEEIIFRRTALDKVSKKFYDNIK